MLLKKFLSLTRISAAAFVLNAPISDFQVAKLEKIIDIKSLINKGFLKILRKKNYVKYKKFKFLKSILYLVDYH